MFGDVDYDPSLAYKAGECPQQPGSCLAAVQPNPAALLTEERD